MAKLIVSLLIFFSQQAHSQQGGAPAAAAPADATEGKDTVAQESDEKKISDIQKFLAPFEYNREDLRDPFETLGSSTPLRPGQVYGPFLPLQVHPLSQYHLKGLLWGARKPVAIFRGPEGEEYRLSVKDYIGENFGYIATIREKEVVVIQTIEENEKRYSTTKVVFLE